MMRNIQAPYRFILPAAAAAAVLLVAGPRVARGQDGSPGVAPSAAPACSNDAGLTLPAGFCASIFADNLGHVRHMAMAPNGVLYVNT
ncbi:MAG: hypothetical protein WBE91_08830 [Steroidobacteraceae bacterium]